MGVALRSHGVRGWEASPFRRPGPPALAQAEAGGFGFIFKMKKSLKESCKHFTEWVSVDVICITSI